MSYDLSRQQIDIGLSGFLSRLHTWVTPAWATNTTMRAVRSGFLLCLPLVVIGALAVLFNNLPLPIYQNAMRELFGPEWRQGLFAVIWQASFGILSPLMVFGISYNLVLAHNQRLPLMPVNPVTAGVVAIGSFVVMLPPDEFVAQLGVPGMFVGMLVGIAATKLFLRLADMKSLQMQIYSGGMDSAQQVFASLIAGILTALFFAAFEFGFRQIFGVHIPEAVHILLLYPFHFDMPNTLDGLIYVFFVHVGWFFGLHGNNVLDPVTRDVFEAATQANLLAQARGLPLPHIVTKNFLDIFVFMGGSGTSICLLAAILLGSRNRGSRRLAKISLLPGLFNINEIVLFGLPVILNPIYLVPFILVPLTLTLTSFVAIRHGLVPPPIVAPGWTTPPLLGGVLATLDAKGSLLQIFNMIVGTLIYLPFVKISDRQKEALQKKAQRELLEVAVSNVVGPLGKKCLDRDDEVGALARILAYDLEVALKTGEGLHLEYQPQIDGRTGRVIGAEALVRWRHPAFGPVPAPVIVAISEDGEFMRPLGLWVLNEACAERARWREAGLDGQFKTSVNVSIRQLDDAGLPDKIVESLERHGLSRHMIGVEVTETIALDPDSEHNRILKRIHDRGLAVSIDDFGMGHSSLVYLKHFPVDVLKIDKVLSKDVINNKICEEIVATIVELCRALNIKIVVEFVDNQEQKEALERLGCHVFQGYYYSPPLPGGKMLDYALGMNAAADARAGHAA
ncbi:MAG: EAL domain-containing protein [Candidatus Accumulibacter sp.]|jgi:lactose/cellobiose-specific phosphotransferase system IIC component|nr:EAL domain-containing protein [Accumulibacter sp.]